MAKMTKTQAKNALNAMQTKADKLFLSHLDCLPARDYIALDKILRAAYKRLK